MPLTMATEGTFHHGGLEEEDDAAHNPHDSNPLFAVHTTEKKPKKQRDANAPLRKAPQAPKRFKSSYICFFMAKQAEIKDELGDKATVTSVSKRSAELWKSLPAEERAHWDDVAAKDKQRYMMEKASYTGPWQVPWKRARKDPSAPKRPMSAFLYFAQGRRTKIKSENPQMKNTEVSRILGEMWRNAPDKDRRPYINKEKEEREKYKTAVAKWKEQADSRAEKERKSMETIGMHVDPNMMQQPAMVFPDHFGNPQFPMVFGQPYYPYPPPPTGLFQFPPNGGKPVILGPSGTPYVSNYSSGTNAAPNGGDQEQHQSPTNTQFSSAGGSQAFDDNPQGYDYSPDVDGEPQTVE